jgi:hypothetical protein
MDTLSDILTRVQRIREETTICVETSRSFCDLVQVRIQASCVLVEQMGADIEASRRLLRQLRHRRQKSERG